MLSKTEKRFVITPSSFKPTKKTYHKRHLKKKITDAAEDIELLIENGYNISEIVESIIHHSGNRIKYIMEQILKTQKIIDGFEPEEEATTVTKSKHIPKKPDDPKKSDVDVVDDSKDEDWDM